MIEITRRNLIAGAACATGVSTFAGPLPAFAPPIGRQVPGIYRYNVGDMEVTAIADGAIKQPLPEAYVRNAGTPEVNAALARLHMEPSRITAPLTAIVVNTGTKLVAFDTGLGPDMFQQSKGAVGQFHANLAAAGIAREAVDAVIISHMHRDHVGGLLTSDNNPAFPNAEIMVPEAEWAFWSDDGNLSRMAAGSIPEINFKNNRRVFGALGKHVTRYAAGREILPGVTSLAAPGHTPGHTAHILSSGQKRVLVQADLTAYSALLFVHNPGWHVFFDMDGGIAESSRRRIYDMVAVEELVVQGYHLPFPALGHIDKAGQSYAFSPAMWNSML